MGIPQSRKRRKKNDSRYVNLNELIKSIDYGRWDHPTTIKAFKVLKQLDKWLASILAPEYCPLTYVIVSAPAIAICIGDCCAWDSETDGEDDLTFDFCKDRYKEEALKIAAILEI